MAKINQNFNPYILAIADGVKFQYFKVFDSTEFIVSGLQRYRD